MRLFINNNYYISWFFVRMFIRLSMENIFFTMRRTFINYTFYNLLFFNNFLSITIFTFISITNLLTGSITIATWTCGLGIHSWTKHSHLSSHTSTFTSRTSRIGSVFSTSSFASLTYSISIYCNFGCFSFINFF